MNATISEFNETLEIMRKVYPFKNDTTRLHNLYNMRDDCYDIIEISTIDEETNTRIILSKEVERNGSNEM